MVACLQPFVLGLYSHWHAFLFWKETSNCQFLYHASNFFYLGPCSLRKLAIIIWLPCAFQTRHLNQYKYSYFSTFLTVNQEIIMKVLTYFSVGSIGVSKGSNHFCFNNKIKFHGMCIYHSI